LALWISLTFFYIVFFQSHSLILSFYWILSFSIELITNQFLYFFLSYNNIEKLIQLSRVYNLGREFGGLTRLNWACFLFFFSFDLFFWTYSIDNLTLRQLPYNLI
jgi:hypothetical protein